MPFGLQTKGVVVGMILGAVIVPRVLTMISSRNG